MELKRVICTQADVQPHLEEVRKGVALVGQEEGIIAEGTHGEPDLLQIEQVLQGGDLAEEYAVRDGVRREEGRCQVVRVAGFATVGTEHECVCIWRVRGWSILWGVMLRTEPPRVPPVIEA